MNDRIKDIVDHFEYFVCGLQLIDTENLRVNSNDNVKIVSYRSKILRVKFFYDELLYNNDEAYCSVTVLNITEIDFNAKLNKNFEIDVLDGKGYHQYTFNKVFTGSDLYDIMTVTFEGVKI